MDILRMLLGVGVRVSGRRLFWLFVAAVGFVSGLALAAQFVQGQPEWMILIIALAAGLVGALLAVFLQQVGVGLAGFIGGGYIAVSLLNVLGWEAGRFTWVPFLVGGVVGLVLVAALFDWALIILSSLTGASLIVQAFRLRPSMAALLFVVLIVVGIVVQARLMRRDRPEPPPPPKA